MRLILLFLSLYLLQLSSVCYAQGQPTQEPNAFEAGVVAYRQHKNEEAEKYFNQALGQSRNNPVILTNLALVEFQMKRSPLAIALLRKASSLNPSLHTSREALKYILSQTEIREVPHEIETWEQIRSSVLNYVSTTPLFLSATVALFALGWSLLRYFGERRKAIESDSVRPGVPFMSAIFAFLFVGLLILGTLKIYDDTISRATVIFEKVTLQTAPGENQVGLLDLPGGSEVVVKQVSADWAQVSYPGAATGWVLKKSLLQTAGRSAW